ncbi:type II toxin-antitoxin system HicA family toxin [Candidatus Kaiserbacteria bacterium]|nr:type II toxin-antitoxin system HicA family toxin [Candidatus Kaiserbacteria bacterium]
MKRTEFERYLREHSCYLLREGGKHSVFHNPREGLTSTVPRHTEIFPSLAKKICKDLGIPPIQKK